MEIKKTSKASLENKKSSWLLVGYVIVLVFMFVAFEWSKRDVRIDMSGAITENVFEQEIEIPITEQPELVAPPPPQAPAIAEVLTIVDDNDNVKETAIASSEEIGEAVIIKPISPTVDEEIPVEDEIFEVVEKNPEFSYNGMSLMQYLGKSIKYPTIAQETGTQGRVIVQFVVNKDGSIVDVKVVRGVDPYLDKEAIRVISTMPEIFSTECATSCVYTDGTTSKSDGTMYQFSIDPASLTSSMTVMYLLDQSKKRTLTSVNTLTKAKVTVTKEGYVVESENTIPTKTFYKFNGKLTDTSLYPVSKLKATIDLENDKYEATMQLGTIAVTANGKVTN